MSPPNFLADFDERREVPPSTHETLLFSIGGFLRGEAVASFAKN